MSALTYDEIVLDLRSKGVPLDKAEAAARRETNAQPMVREDTRGREATNGQPQDGAAQRPTRIIDPLEVGVSEKRVEQLCDELARKLGAKVVKFSHPGKTKQTEGIADRLYCFVKHDPDHRIAVWWEVKSEAGKQRPGQREFEEWVTACDQLYGCGGFGDFKAWLVAHGMVESFEPDGTTPIMPDPMPALQTIDGIVVRRNVFTGSGSPFSYGIP
jgi:hypothetical protein